MSGVVPVMFVVLKNSLLQPAMLTFLTCALVGTAFAEHVKISTPAHEDTVGTPFHLVASGRASVPVTGITVYVNGVKTASAASSELDTYIQATPGRTRVTVQAFDENGPFQRTIYVNVAQPNSPTGISSGNSSTGVPTEGTGPIAPPESVGSGSSSDNTPTEEAPTPDYPARARIIPNIEHMDRWESCSVCAGPGGKGKVARYSMRRAASPSQDGKSLEFKLEGSDPYADALWWRQLGPQDDARHFVYDLQFYVEDPGSAQALEFDVNQSVGDKKYIFGTECSLKRGVWDIWASGKSWIPTDIPCGSISAFTWHHVIWEFERTSKEKVKFVSVTLDGKKSYVNREFAPQPSHAREMNVAFQMDGDRQQNKYSVWLDNIKLIYW